MPLRNQSGISIASDEPIGGQHYLMSSPLAVTIRSLTPGDDAVAFTIDEGDVMPKPPSTVLKNEMM